VLEVSAPCSKPGSQVVCRKGFPPFEVPDSIRELALRPRIPRLLRLCPLPARSSLISLFRRITGVSANGNAILEVAARAGSGDWNTLSSTVFVFFGRPFLPVFSIGSGPSSFRPRVDRSCFSGGPSSSRDDRLRRPRDGFPFIAPFMPGSSSAAPPEVLLCFVFGGRPLFGEF
jgi:hypothetical protein